MSTLRVNTIQDSTGSSTPAINGLARAWVNFNGTGTVAIRASLNVTSITDNGTGDYTINFTTALSDANYSFSFALGNGTSAPTGAAWAVGSFSTSTYLAGSLRINCVYSSGGGSGSFDPNPVGITVFR
jgi:hypothetical protein